MQTISDLLERNQGHHQTGITVYDRRGKAVVRRSYGEIAARSRAMATRFAALGFEAGEPVFLQLPNSMSLIECILGAVVQGLVPCCLAPPRALGGLEVFQERVRLLLTSFPRGHFVAPQSVGEAAGCAFVEPPEVNENDVEAELRASDPESIAFVQLTSGSTRSPKAVRISHRAVLANIRRITEVAAVDPEVDEAVSWLPFYHDMGLVGVLFSALYARHELHLMQPDTFLARPLRWLQVLSDVQGFAMSTAPNSAYDSCVQRITREEAAALDLSRWRLAGCGAERVRPGTLAAFADHFAASGFREESFVACYGLAEATLAVTFGKGGRRLPTDGPHVSCGRPVPETEVVIRDEDSSPLEEGRQGEITVRSPSLCSGYAGTDDGTPVRDGWLYTGDRGYLRRGELYVTGRYKDLIIIDGVNYDPDEFESIGESVTDVAGARSGAFSVEDGGRECVVLVNEADPRSPAEFEDSARSIGERVASLFGFNVHDMVFVRRGSMKKTSSGKVTRTELKRAYENDELQVLWRQKGGSSGAE